MNYCIFLTASIDPPNTIGLNRKHVAEREHDYFTALQFYSRFGLPIVFCENSGYQSQQILDFCKGNPGMIEYLSFVSKESHKGKSHGEAEIFHFAHQHSATVKQADVIFKLTGRLILENFESMLANIRKTDALVYANLIKNLTFADSRFFAYKKEFYHDYLEQTLSSQLNDAQRFYFENCLARSIHLMLSERNGFELLPEYAFFNGFNGTTNRTYKKSIIGKLKFSGYYKLKRFLFKYSI